MTPEEKKQLKAQIKEVKEFKAFLNNGKKLIRELKKEEKK